MHRSWTERFVAARDTHHELKIPFRFAGSHSADQSSYSAATSYSQAKLYKPSTGDLPQSIFHPAPQISLNRGAGKQVVKSLLAAQRTEERARSTKHSDAWWELRRLGFGFRVEEFRA